MIQIVQCWDDGVLDDIRLCEILRAHGAKASFNLNPGLHGATRSAPWRYKECKDVSRLATSELTSVYEGFTIANHTVSHPWPLKIPITEWRAEVFDGRKQLQDIFQQPILGFAYPYGQHDEATAAVVAEAGHTYGRAVLNATPCHPSPDRFRQPTDCHHAAPDFWEIFERAKAAGATVFYFWGHSYEFLTEEDWQAYTNKLIRFNADPDIVWADLPAIFPS
jgi:peptidoglycan/xylan/chitin deacetylase (PgdA/CDA1 family)